MPLDNLDGGLAAEGPGAVCIGDNSDRKACLPRPLQGGGDTMIGLGADQDHLACGMVVYPIDEIRITERVSDPFGEGGFIGGLT